VLLSMGRKRTSQAGTLRDMKGGGGVLLLKRGRLRGEKGETSLHKDSKVGSGKEVPPVGRRTATAGRRTNAQEGSGRSSGGALPEGESGGAEEKKNSSRRSSLLLEGGRLIARSPRRKSEEEDHISQRLARRRREAALLSQGGDD